MATKQVRFNGTDFAEFPDVKVQDIRNLAEFFDIDISPRRLTLSGTVFSKTIGERIVLHMSELPDHNEEKAYVNKLYENVPSLQRPNESDPGASITHFSKWLTTLHNIDNLMPYLNLHGSSIVQSSEVNVDKRLSLIVNKVEPVIPKHDEHEKAFVGVEPLPVNLSFKQRCLSIEALQALIEILPSYFLHEKHFINCIKDKITVMDKTRTSECEGIIGEFIDATHNSVKENLTTDRAFLNDVFTRTNNLFKLYKLSQSTVPVPAAVQRINMLFQGFDMVDMLNVDLLQNMNDIEVRYGTALPIVFHTRIDDDLLEPNYNALLIDNHERAKIALLLLSLHKTSVSDVYNIYITPELRVTTISDVLGSHACDSVFLLQLLMNLTRTETYFLKSNYSNQDAFIKALQVVIHGKYPVHTPFVQEYVSFKKRMTALRVAQMYVESQFTAYLKYNRIDIKNQKILFWHSLFFRNPILFKRLLMALKNDKYGLGYLPINLLSHALAQLRDKERNTRLHSTRYNEIIRIRGRSTKMYLRSPLKMIHIYLDAFKEVLNVYIGGYSLRNIFIQLQEICGVDAIRIIDFQLGQFPSNAALLHYSRLINPRRNNN